MATAILKSLLRHYASLELDAAAHAETAAAAAEHRRMAAAFTRRAEELS